MMGMDEIKLPRRGKKPSMGNEHFLIARCSKEEQVLVRRASRLKGLTVSDFMRRTMLPAAKRVLEDKGLAAVVREKYENPKRMEK